MPLDTNKFRLTTADGVRLSNWDNHLTALPTRARPISRLFLITAAILCLSSILVCEPSSGADARKDATRVAQSIRQRLESELFTLDPEIQGHYALRMYRITGDQRYLPSIVFNLLVTLENLRSDIAQVDDSSYVAGRCAAIRADLNPNTRKGHIRAEMFERAGAVQFYLNLLHSANALDELGVRGVEPFREPFLKALVECRPTQIESFLLDTATIRAYAPQAVNYVYYLYDLGLADIRQAYTESFRVTYPDKADHNMDPDEFSDKVYGLTHFITAASRYYQRPVDSVEFAWILNYFDKNLKRVLDDTREDVVAEVGLCFLLAGQEESPVVTTCRKRLIDRFDSGEGLIPSTTGQTDLAQSEHRNVIAYMLLKWPEQLHSGPNLPEAKFFQDVLGHSDRSGE
jgi:hypothetical protein